jgi:hypothetical protein
MASYQAMEEECCIKHICPTLNSHLTILMADSQQDIFRDIFLTIIQFHRCHIFS